MTAFKLSGLFAGAAFLVSASVAFGSDFNPQPDPPRHAATAGTHADFNPQPDPPGRHVNADAAGCPQTMHGMDRDAASGLPSGKRKAGGEQDARKAGGNDQPSLACANGKH